MPPRTGTTSLAKILKGIGFVSTTGHHSFLHETKHISGLEIRKVYGFFRNPLDRFLSALAFLKTNDAFLWRMEANLKVAKEKFNTMEPEDYVKRFYDIYKIFPSFFYPQHLWLEGAEVLDFNNFNDEVNRVLAPLTDMKFEIPILNVGINKPVPTEATAKFVKYFYAADYQFGQSRLNKKY